MSSGTKVILTHEEGQFLLRMAANVRAPKKLGEPLDLGMQAFVDDWITQLRGLLKTYSPKLSMDRKLCFGDASNWEMMEGAPHISKMIDPHKQIEMRFEDDVFDGAYWCLLIALHPESEFKVSLNEVDDAVWPIAGKLGYTDALREAVGLNTKTKARRAQRVQEIAPKFEDHRK